MRPVAWAAAMAATVMGATAVPAVAVGPRDVAPDGRAAVYDDSDPQAAADTDDAFGSMSIEGATPDLGRVFFATGDRLVSEDTNFDDDVYLDSPDGPRLALVGPSGVAPGIGRLLGASDSGDRWFFTTSAALVAGDTDASRDLYIRLADGTTRLLSP